MRSHSSLDAFIKGCGYAFSTLSCFSQLNFKMMKRQISILIVLCIVQLYTPNLKAQNPGDLDLLFNPGDIDGSVYDIVVQSDGKIIIGGSFTTINGIARDRIARLNQDGSLDVQFDPASGFNGSVLRLAIQSDGKIITSGLFSQFDGTSRNFIARLNEDGSLDTSFDPGSGFDDRVNDLLLLPNGKILLGGVFTLYNGSLINRIVRLNSDGSLDPSFMQDVLFEGDDVLASNPSVNSLALQSDGKIVVGGDFPLGPIGNTDFIKGVFRLNPDGSFDETFNIGEGPRAALETTSLVFNVELKGDKILVNGGFTTFDLQPFEVYVRLLSDGSLDPGFTPALNPGFWGVTLQSDDKIIVGGQKFGRLLPGGSLDPEFNVGTGFSGFVLTTTIQSDGKILVGGSFTSYDNEPINSLARLYSNAQVDNTPPSAPELTVGAIGETSVGLNWAAANDNVGVVSYDIFQETELVGSTSELFFLVDNLEACTDYTFTAVAKDAAGNTATSNQVNPTTWDSTPPEIASLPEVMGCSVTLTPPLATDNCAGEIIGTTSAPLTFNTPGSYTVSWTFDDGNENSVIADQSVIVTNQPIIEILNVTASSSLIDSDGAISFRVNGGSFPFQYSITGESLTDNLSGEMADSSPLHIENLPTGTYGIQITSNTACDADTEFFVPIINDICFAAEVVNFSQGKKKNSGTISDQRSNPEQALSAPQENDTYNFVSLGFGGSITLELGQDLYDDGTYEPDLILVETSFGRADQMCYNSGERNYPEMAFLEVSEDNNTWYSLPNAYCRTSFVDISPAVEEGLSFVRYLRITDASNKSWFGGNADGYDVDGIITCREEVLAAFDRLTNSRTLASGSTEWGEFIAFDPAFFNKAPNEEAQFAVKMFPNPIKDQQLHLEYSSENSGNGVLRIVDIMGKTLLEKAINLQPGLNRLELDVAALPIGHYVLQLQLSQGERVVEKVIKY